MRELDFHRFKTGNPKNIKISQLKKKNRKSSISIKQEDKEIQMIFGSVWGIQDRHVAFGEERKDEHIKDSLRPCLALETPSKFGDNSNIEVAPGSSNFWNNQLYTEKIITASVPPEDLERTTYFKIHLAHLQLQKHLEKKFCDLSNNLINQLEKILNG